MYFVYANPHSTDVCEIISRMTNHSGDASPLQTIFHSSEVRGLCSTKCSSEMLQNLLYFMYKKTHVFFVCFSFRATLYFYLMNALITACHRQCSDKFVWACLLCTNYERSVHIESLFMLKTIPACYSPTMIFSKN